MTLSRPHADAQPGRGAASDRSRLALIAAAVVALLIVAATGAAVWWSLLRVREEIAARDLDTAEALAGALGQLPAADREAALPAPSDGRVFALVAPDGSVSPPVLGRGQDDSRWRRWASRVAREAGLERQFRLPDPAGVRWRYVTAPMPDGSTVLLGRAEAPQTALLGDALRAVLALLLGVSLLGAVAWPLVRHGFLRPLDDLSDAAEDLRWRGEVRPAARERLDRLARRSDYIGQLARSLGGVADQGERQVLRHRDLRLDTEALRATVRDRDVELTPTELALLRYFMENAGKALPHARILKEVWGDGYGDNIQYVRVYVSRLRQKIETDPTEPDYFTTEHGLGYRFGD